MRPQAPEHAHHGSALAAFTLGALLLLAGTTSAPAAPPPPARSKAAAPALLEAAHFQQPGFSQSIRLTGDHSSVTIPFSVRLRGRAHGASASALHSLTRTAAGPVASGRYR
jgi:hypothetical protein